MTVNRLSLLAITLCLAITGCSTAITATRDTPIQDDKGTRTFGSKIDDSLIETKVEVNVAKAATDLGNGASLIVVTSLNGLLIVTTTGLALWLWTQSLITVGAIALATGLVIRIVNMSGWIDRKSVV